MSAVLQVADQRLGAEDICALLTSPQVLPHLLRELIVEQITATVDCTTEELESAFREMSQLPQYRSLPPAHVERLIPRQLKLEKFKTASWSDQVEAEFLQRQERYDQVLFSLIQTDNLEIIQELYFRLREGEANFGEIATQYSQGPEARTNGLVGPLELYNLHPKLSHMLRISQPGQVSPPFRVDQWVVIVRLERYLPAQFDEKLRQRLIDEKYESWMQQAIAQHAGSVRVPEVLDLPTIDLHDQADLKRNTSGERPRLSPAAATQTTPSEATPTHTPQAPSQPQPPTPNSPFADETLLDAELETAPTPKPDPKHKPAPANETLAFTPPSRMGLNLNKIRVPQFRGSLLLTVLPLLFVLGALAALLGWDSQLQTFTQSLLATPASTNDVATRDIPTERAAVTDAHGAEATDVSTATIAPPAASAALNLAAADEAKVSVPLPDDVLPDDVPTPFHTAVNHANQAVMLIPQASNPTDWKRIAREWEQAVELMQTVPSDHPQADVAQAKAKEYQDYLSYAQTQSQNPDHAFLLAVRQAEAAAQTSQTAQATRDWQAVLRGWDEAIAAMKAVPVESEHYGLAQEKVREYQGYREAIEAIAAGQPLASAAR